MDEATQRAVLHRGGMTESTAYEIAARGAPGTRSMRLLIGDFEITQSEPGGSRLVGVTIR